MGREVGPGVEAILAASVQEARQAGAGAVTPIHLLTALLERGEPELDDQLADSGLMAEDLIEIARGRAAAVAEPAQGPLRVSGRVRRLLAAAHERAEQYERPLVARDLMVALLGDPDADVSHVFEIGGVETNNLIGQLASLERGSAIDRTDADVLPDAGDEADAEPPEGIERTLFPLPAVEAPPAPSSPRRGWEGLPAPIPIPPTPQPVRPRKSHPATPTLDRFVIDYTAKAQRGGFDPLIGRKEELKEIVRTLLRKSQSNVMLVGEAGVGKTALVEGLATAAAAPNAPEEILDYRVVELSITDLISAGRHAGEFEEVVQAVVSEAQSDPDLVVFIDEIHAIVGATATGRGAHDLANMLKPALSRGSLRLIGATTPEEYRKHIEKDAALARRFAPVRMEEPSVEEAKEILAGLRPRFEDHHGVSIDTEAIDAAVELGVRYLPDRRLPAKACDALDQACANKRFMSFTPRRRPAGVPAVTRADVADVICHWTGTPVERLGADEGARLLRMEEALGKRVIGQDHAVEVVAKALRTAMAGLARPGRPYGVFLFLGPTGVGKTELAKALAEFLFDDERALLRFDMSEYHDQWTVQKLIGSPPGYVGYDEGGQLTNAIRRRPFSVVLFDEVEKAHPNVANIFLQIFDEGRLTAASGAVADFCHAVIILTSNLGADEAAGRRREVGFRRPSDEAQPRGAFTEDDARDLMARHFRPELVNRIQRIVPFYPLRPEHVRLIIDKILAGVLERVAARRIEVELAPGAYEVLMKLGFDPDYGARAMERVVEEQIVAPLAEGLLNKTYPPGSKVYVLPSGDALTLSTKPGA